MDQKILDGESHLKISSRRVEKVLQKNCLCYLEICRPSLSEAVKDLADSNFKISTINIHSIFLSAGVHFNEDIKAMVSDLQATYPNLKFKINDVVSNNSIVSNAILKVVTS